MENKYGDEDRTKTGMREEQMTEECRTKRVKRTGAKIMKMWKKERSEYGITKLVKRGEHN